MIKLFKNLSFVIGIMALLLGLVSLVDAFANYDSSIAALVSIIGFSFIGIILLSVSKALTFKHIDN
jgi:hypothetical protein